MNNSCNRCNSCKDCDNCIMDTLQVICILQANACPENCLNSCDRPVLGGSGTCVTCNTRPITFYTCCNNTPIEFPITRTAEGETSNVFRVEKIDGCCCTCRVLAPNTDTTSPYPYIGTDSIFTINVNCIGAIRCLVDTYVENVCC